MQAAGKHRIANLAAQQLQSLKAPVGGYLLGLSRSAHGSAARRVLRVDSESWLSWLEKKLLEHRGRVYTPSILPVTRRSLAACNTSAGNAVPCWMGLFSRAPPDFSHAPTGSEMSEMCTAAPGPRSGALASMCNLAMSCTGSQP